ncbi:DCN1 protein 3-like [Tropilaelaps mercedesae]|uniref:Defective in cullin neddylation protein n=1 Tax=Tropilaelaps mercedesae TaxID=418985 RepID=A0A1V9XHW9_9ACAR|nr:DCN1 protein 3-like [Tropilaelaps mercedesae]
MGNVCCVGGGGGGAGSSASKRAAPTSPLVAGSDSAPELQEQLRGRAQCFLEQQQPQSTDGHDGVREGSLGRSRRAIPPTKLFKGTLSSADNSATSSSQLAKRCSYNLEKIASLFEKYKEPTQTIIGANGISQLCKDLEIPAEDFRILVLAWKCQAKVMCQFSRTEFIQGLSNLGADSVPSLAASLNRVASELRPLGNDDQYYSLYKWVFTFAPVDEDEDCEVTCNGQKQKQKNRLSVEMASQLWAIVFQEPHRPALVDKWLEFLDANAEQIGWISRDTWNLFLVLVQRCAHDLSTYDETEAWPSLFDDFVHFHNDQTNQNCAKNNSPWDEQGNGNVISSP